MLFDSSASHSFIAASVVIELGLEVETLEVEVGIWVGPDGPEWAGPKFRRAGP